MLFLLLLSHNLSVCRAELFTLSLYNTVQHCTEAVLLCTVSNFITFQQLFTFAWCLKMSISTVFTSIFDFDYNDNPLPVAVLWSNIDELELHNYSLLLCTELLTLYCITLATLTSLELSCLLAWVNYDYKKHCYMTPLKQRTFLWSIL